jgi:fructose transport system substrate-binding protein
VGPALIDARAAGVLVIALDTPLADKNAQDMTFATDNFEAGLLIGQWAAATLGADAANAKIGMLDINKDNISVDVARDTGFLVGFGIDVPNLNVMGSETDPRVIGHETSYASVEGGVTAMENLLAREPDINVVYTINEPAAEGAYQALQNAGKTGVLVVSVDGGCPWYCQRQRRCDWRNVSAIPIADGLQRCGSDCLNLQPMARSLPLQMV